MHSFASKIRITGDILVLATANRFYGLNVIDPNELQQK